ncbi:metallophosphoesterase family protein [soil metagenome]
MRVAILADIHGNLPALEAVLENLKQQSPDALYFAGDQINRCPWSNEVMDLLATLGWPAIQGNHELVVGAINTPANRPPFTNRARFIDLWWTQEHLHPHHLETIRALPAELQLSLADAPPIRLLHGIPGNSFIGILAETTDDMVQKVLAPVEENVVVCAHTHRPMERSVESWQILNGGSVGSSYDGDPRAHYLLLDTVNGHWQPTFCRVDYDRSVLPSAFHASGMLAALGPLGQLHLRTILDGEPWSSDFGFWMRTQPIELQQDLALAVTFYLEHHGPGRWAFIME